MFSEMPDIQWVFGRRPSPLREQRFLSWRHISRDFGVSASELETGCSLSGGSFVFNFSLCIFDVTEEPNWIERIYAAAPAKLWNECSCEADIAGILSSHAQPAWQRHFQPHLLSLLRLSASSEEEEGNMNQLYPTSITGHLLTQSSSLQMNPQTVPPLLLLPA